MQLTLQKITSMIIYLDNHQPHLIMVHDNFSHVTENLNKLGFNDGIDGIYYDLGFLPTI